jgi:hypothetical protein
MKTPNTLHETKCCKCEGVVLAIVTIPNPGDEPRGYCLDHLIEHEQEALANRAADELMNAVLRSLGGNTA